MTVAVAVRVRSVAVAVRVMRIHSNGHVDSGSGGRSRSVLQIRDPSLFLLLSAFGGIRNNSSSADSAR